MVDIISDVHRQADVLCQQGIELCEEEKDLAAAHQVFVQALQLDPTSARANSWLGYTTGMVDKKVQRGLELCRKAIDSHTPDAMFYRNIGKLYLLQNNKRGAVGAFAKGLQIDRNNRAIMNEWKALGFRRKVPFGFMDRSHWLNEKVGKFTWWLAHRSDKK